MFLFSCTRFLYVRSTIKILTFIWELGKSKRPAKDCFVASIASTNWRFSWYDSPIAAYICTSPPIQHFYVCFYVEASETRACVTYLKPHFNNNKIKYITNMTVNLGSLRYFARRYYWDKHTGILLSYLKFPRQSELKCGIYVGMYVCG